MATIPLVESVDVGEFVKSIAHGSRSQERVTVAQGQVLKPGTILGVVTATGRWRQVTLGASDGSQTAAAILIGNVDTTAAELPAAVIARDAEVNPFLLTYPAGATTNQIAAINASLATVGVLVRP